MAEAAWLVTSRAWSVAKPVPRGRVYYVRPTTALSLLDAMGVRRG
jgi:hypothetical protein